MIKRTLAIAFAAVKMRVKRLVEWFHTWPTKFVAGYGVVRDRARAFLLGRFWKLRIAADIKGLTAHKWFERAWEMVALIALTLGIDVLVVLNAASINALQPSVLDALLPSAAAMLGVILAITLSFRLFAIQVATEREAPSLLPLLVRDPVNRAVIAILSALVLVVFAFAVVQHLEPSAKTLSLIVTATSVGLALVLLRIQFLRNVSLANPIVQVKRLVRIGRRALRRMQRFADGIADSGLVRSPGSADLPPEERRRLYRNYVFTRYAGFLGEPVVRHGVYLIDTITARAVRRQDNDVVAAGLDGSCTLIAEYLALRRDTLGLVPESPFSFSATGDEILKEFLQRLEAVASETVRNRDVALTRSFISALGMVGVAASQLEFAGGQGENPTLWLVQTYLKEITRNAIGEGLAEVGLSAIDVERRLGIICASRGLPTLVADVAEHLAEIGTLGLVRPAKNPLTDPAMSALSELIGAVATSDRSSAIETRGILARASELTDFAVAAIPSAAPLNLTFAIRGFWDLTRATAIAHIQATLARSTLEETEPPVSNRRQSGFLEFDQNLYQFFNRFGRPDLTSESLLFVYLRLQVRQVVLVLLRLATDKKWTERRKTLFEHIGWHLSSLWRSYDKVTAIRQRYPVEFSQEIIASAIHLHEVGQSAQAVRLVPHARALGEFCAERGEDTAKRYALDVAAELTLLGALAVKTDQKDLLAAVDEASVTILSQYQKITGQKEDELRRWFRGRVEALREVGPASLDDAVIAASPHVDAPTIDEYAQRVLQLTLEKMNDADG